MPRTKKQITIASDSDDSSNDTKKETMPRKKKINANRRWCLTIFNYEKIVNGKSMLQNLYLIKCGIDEDVRFIIFQGELCPTTLKKHLQCYVQLNKTIRMKALMSLLGVSGAHCEVAKGSPIANVKYCSKEESFDKDANIRYSCGTNDVHRGTRNDLSKIVENINGGSSFKDAVNDCPETFIRNYKGLQKYYEMVQRPRNRKKTPQTILHFGESQAGKTLKVFEDHPEEEIYPVPCDDNGKIWFDNYDPVKHKVVLFDEFFGGVQLQYLNKLLDRYKGQVAVKGGYMQFNPSIIYFTSQHSPQKWYPNITNEQLYALVRRFTKILYWKRDQEPMDITEEYKAKLKSIADNDKSDIEDFLELNKKKKKS